ncbi:Similar to Striatin Pro11; acc. no. Q70M86 [Pyronema omphalodes CBS 100304]|uniref:Similar to Striatin Pro11 acc. no. Q70M86 n=1 Tax=Pyronema omphalodes (strain CBS 100304) TaxID=1076935 RepID=U4LVI8_PYROM|nr:Similar to Striatin Pro11; acc. no. Q70M86 [Pyronema omphalodes CBS 100304]
MVWQSPFVNNSAGDGAGGSNGALPQQQQQQQQGQNGPVGAEYTLQGVMRFLQTEWHKHERDRNNWEIERAEMKARIAKLEGENRAEKRLHQVHQARIQILERALKQERAKRAEKEGKTGEQLDAEEKTATEADKARSEKIKRLDETSSLYKAESARNKSRAYLEKCLQEITYLLKPPSHPPPAATSTNPSPPAPHSLTTNASRKDILEAILAGQNPRNLGSPAPPPSEQPPPPPNTIELPIRQSLRNKLPPKEAPTNPFSSVREEKQRASGSQPQSDAEPESRPSTSEIDDADVWDFDTSDSDSTDTTSSPITEGSSTSSSPRRKISHAKSSINRRPAPKQDGTAFKVKFALRGHLDSVRAACFTNHGSSTEPEVATAGDDGLIKRWLIPAGLSMSGFLDVDVQSHFTHRGHTGIVTCLAASGASSNGNEGWLFSGGSDTCVMVWKHGQVQPVNKLEGHTDAIWAVTILPTLDEEKILLASGSADGTVKIWSIAKTGNAEHSLVSTIKREPKAGVTAISQMSPTGETFLVAYNDASVVIYDTATGEEVVEMQSRESYDGTPATGVSCVVATTIGLEAGEEGEEKVAAGATGTGKTGGTVISGSEDSLVRFFDANSGQCTYTMLAHPNAISSLALSPDGRELVSAGHDASLRFWSMEKRACTQEITSHRPQNNEGICAVVWSSDGKWVVSGGGDGVVKVYCR